MDMHVTLHSDDLLYWFGWSIAAFIILFPIWLGLRLSPSARDRFEKIWGLLLILSYLVYAVEALNRGVFSIQESLLFHMCGWSRIFAVVYLWTKKQWVGEFVTFIGIAGGLQSLLTPELTHGIALMSVADYYFNHSSIIAVGFYILFVQRQRLKRGAWLRSFGRAQVLAAIAVAVNYFIGSNYMYLSEPPKADNPLIITSEQLPYLYVVFFELFILLHFLVLQFALTRIRVRNIRR